MMVKAENVLLEVFGILFIALLGIFECAYIGFSISIYILNLLAYGACSFYSFLPVYKAYSG